MGVSNRVVLNGSPAEIVQRARDAGELVPAEDRLAGRWLRDLAVRLAANTALLVSVVTYLDSCQMVEVAVRFVPGSDVVTVSRSESGEDCQITVNRWVPIGDDAERSVTAGLITAILGLFVPVNRGTEVRLNG